MQPQQAASQLTFNMRGVSTRQPLIQWIFGSFILTILGKRACFSVGSCDSILIAKFVQVAGHPTYLREMALQSDHFAPSFMNQLEIFAESVLGPVNLGDIWV